MNTNNNYQFSKSAVGFFSFFSSTNVETKNVCPIAYNTRIDAVFNCVYTLLKYRRRLNCLRFFCSTQLIVNKFVLLLLKN